MTQRITICEDTAAILERLEAHTGLTANGIVNRLLSSHLSELHEIDAFLETHPAGVGLLHNEGKNLIQSYGPESLLEGIARIAPYYETLAARFEREMNESINASPASLQ